MVVEQVKGVLLLRLRLVRDCDVEDADRDVRPKLKRLVERGIPVYSEQLLFTRPQP
ncbi:hypothetical protein [Streptomyces sp. NPDC088816]|uniref:hypothetical protein n=1 Tax=Streptomyces sp. NPDC088816 TaxID=3365906 RepID=UPI0038167537